MPQLVEEGKSALCIALFGINSDDKTEILDALNSFYSQHASINVFELPNEEIKFIEYKPFFFAKNCFRIYNFPSNWYHDNNLHEFLLDMDGFMLLWDLNDNNLLYNQVEFLNIKAFNERIKNEDQSNKYNTNKPIHVIIKYPNNYNARISNYEDVYWWLQQNNVNSWEIIDLHSPYHNNLYMAFKMLQRDIVLNYYQYSKIPERTPRTNLILTEPENVDHRETNLNPAALIKKIRSMRGLISQLKSLNQKLKNKIQELQSKINSFRESSIVDRCCSICGLYLFHPRFPDDVFIKCENENCRFFAHFKCAENIVQDSLQQCPICKSGTNKIQFPAPSLILLFRDELKRNQRSKFIPSVSFPEPPIQNPPTNDDNDQGDTNLLNGIIANGRQPNSLPSPPVQPPSPPQEPEILQEPPDIIQQQLIRQLLENIRERHRINLGQDQEPPPQNEIPTMPLHQEQEPILFLWEHENHPL
ncbi:MAG: hypothetical protein ACTSWN_16780, partial [Promethearchaeota archaeon]